MIVMSIGQRIKTARQAKRWTQERLAAAIGRTQTAVSSWERDRTQPTREDVVRIAVKLGVPISDIEDILGRKPGAAFPVQQVPLIAWVSAGEISDIGQLDNYQADDFISVGDLSPGDYFATDVRGDSMDRISPDGSRIIVKAGDKTLIPGRAYIFSVRGETTYKIYQDQPIQRLEPYSTNPLNKTIYLDRRETWFVVGRVVRSYIDLE